MPTSTNTVRIQSSAELTPEVLKSLNNHLSTLEPREILEWAIDHLPNLHQTTAMGLTGLVSLDLISKISIDREQPHLVPLIFLDTLYHFNETLDLVRRCEQVYDVKFHIYKPLDCETAQEFEKEHGQHLWEVDEATYDFLVKVEPAQRAYQQHNVQSVITGRRRSQKGDRENIPILEVDSTGLIKLNPLALWDFKQVWTYIRANEVPYNALVDEGYRSIGDWHSTKKPMSEDDERSGRWSGKQKTECGLHQDYFKMRAAFVAAKKKKEQQAAARAAANTPTATPVAV
ncbi:phosphoadenosine phosphosulfate reductase [Lichtheimia corymbifera JMRC:FSU:9682]|uniref:Phosphoadenosine phosphosulfate reductase n=1 Tax=Lichtheimia corymbifera JMRC:FSU:9682 TaxID=1263082 RepID=A0A068RW53_9FUNG|nr:phosphoadenosine phosphosulfate reductase [Lichtheimia corymbifera JMRC:FSU:9682]